MPEDRLGAVRGLSIVALSALTLGVGLGGSGRLTYHEAIAAQSTREMVARGDMLVPHLGGLPWLEKPPLIHWLTALSAAAVGGRGEAAVRLPSAVAATLLALGLAAWAARRFGPAVGWLAGLVQVTTGWTVMRGRLAEPDMLLAALVTGTLLALDQVRAGGNEGSTDGRSGKAGDRWLWAFWTLLGLTLLAKGIGFGAALVTAAAVPLLVWDRDGRLVRRLRHPAGWALAAVLALTWPVLVVLRHPSALGLWARHVFDRLSARPEYFAGEAWWQFGLAPFLLVLPWTPLALAGAVYSLTRAVRRRRGPDRFLWAWAVGPSALLALATVKNGHYLIAALPPWSIWAAFGLIRLGDRLRRRLGWSPRGLRLAAAGGFAALGVICAVGFAVLGPWFDRRGVEWAFYESAADRLRPGEPLALLYDAPGTGRKPYDTPFGPVPHDLAVRLYYLDRPACCRFGIDDLADRPPVAPGSDAAFAVIGRDADLPALRRLGRVETLAEGPSARSDRTFRLYRVSPRSAPVADRSFEEGGRGTSPRR